jgi:PAS domain S-box-containing protein
MTPPDVPNGHPVEGDAPCGGLSYKELVENLSEVLYATDIQGLVTYVSPNVFRIGGYTQAEIIGRPFTDFVSPKDLPGRLEAFQRILNGSNEPTEYRYVAKDGRLIWVRTRARPIIRSGRTIGLQGVLVDITERREREEALRQSEETYRTIFENSGIPMIMVNEDMSIALANAEVEAVFGYAPEAIQGRIWTEFIPEANRPDLLRFRSERRRRSQPSPGKITTQVRDMGGALKDVIITAALIPGSTQAIISLLDMTEQYTLQQQLQQAQKMEALGTLSGGVAHDFNNILQGLSGGIELIKLKTGNADPVADTLQAMERTVARGKQVVTRLLTFSRKSRPCCKDLDLGSLIASTGELLRRTLPKRLILEIRLAEDAPMVCADASQMEQLLLNLVNNAKDAFQGDEPGRIVISLARRRLDTYARELGGLSPGDYALLEVTDTGSGMEASVQEKIFEPFFSTKGPGRGTGLGLPSALGIVQSHSGRINCSSRPGHGTTFSVLLPAGPESALPADSANQAGGQSAVPKSRGETLLVVDDEGFVRESTAALLTHTGYTVLSAASGEEAVDLAGANRIDAVIMDLDMPGIGGSQAIRRIRGLQPQSAMLVVTGHGHTPGSERDLEGCAILNKPFTIESMLRLLRKLLDGASSDPSQAPCGRRSEMRRSQ